MQEHGMALMVRVWRPVGERLARLCLLCVCVYGTLLEDTHTHTASKAKELEDCGGGSWG